MFSEKDIISAVIDAVAGGYSSQKDDERSQRIIVELGEKITSSTQQIIDEMRIHRDEALRGQLEGLGLNLKNFQGFNRTRNFLDEILARANDLRGHLFHIVTNFSRLDEAKDVYTIFITANCTYCLVILQYILFIQSDNEKKEIINTVRKTIDETVSITEQLIDESSKKAFEESLDVPIGTIAIVPSEIHHQAYAKQFIETREKLFDLKKLVV